MIKKYRKKPLIVKAVQWDGKNLKEIKSFMKDYRRLPFMQRKPFSNEESLVIPTLEGTIEATNGDYIIKGVKGEFYLCKPDMFKKTYEEIK